MTRSITLKDLIKIDSTLFEIASSYRSDMRVPARIFMNQSMIEQTMQDSSLTQIVNVATLPGILKYALAMPDIHQGYGFPIGGVAAVDIDNNGVISPGGIGYDINCGVRLLKIDMTAKDIKPYLEKIATALFQAVPSGVGRSGPLKCTKAELDDVLTNGAHAMVNKGYGSESDLEHCEENGRMQADPASVSAKAKDRGYDQLGTLGSGNHFLEIQQVSEIFQPEIAHAFGLKEGMVTIMVHCGSRGLGHQTCTDHVRAMLPKLEQWGIVLPDQELACAPFYSQEGQHYYQAMAASANFAWANRHTIGHHIRQTIKTIVSPDIKVETIYDVSHNIGKKEEHKINGKLLTALVHRKGATRAFPAGHPEIPFAYRAVGQPVLIPGTMGTSSYVLVGTPESMQASFGSCCHGAGRSMSRTKAKKTITIKTLEQQLKARGIIIRCDSTTGLLEEAPIAYKDIDCVIDVVQQARLAHKVARLTPIAVIKGG
jgi:tRNA-splicing ligase RtcB (3'-phosphate/5'-hydroxy nucleic acid ligase)